MDPLLRRGSANCADAPAEHRTAAGTTVGPQMTQAGNDTDVETDTETALLEIREQNEMRSEQVHATKRRIGNYDSV